MKNLLNIGVYMILAFTTTFLIISGFQSSKRNKDYATRISELKIVDNYYSELISAELNSLMLEKYLKAENQIFFEKADKSTILLSILKKDPPCLYFFMNEYSCSACLDIEFHHLKQFSDSLKMPTKIICISQDWRFMKLLRQNYNIKNEIYRLSINNSSLNDELLFIPFYFMISEGSINFIFIPIK